MDNEIIADFLERYDSWDKGHDSKYKKEQAKKEKLLDDFLRLFPYEKLSTLEIDQYIVGKKDKTFCWWVETGLAAHGDIRPKYLTSYQKFGLDYDKKKKCYRFGGEKVKKTKFGSDYETIFKNIRKSLIELVDASIRHDYAAIEKSPLNDLFKNKITYLYNRNDYLPIYSDGDLNIVLAILEIPFSVKEDRIYKRQKLFEFYKKLNRSDIGTLNFMRFIYNEAGFRPYLRSNENAKLKDKVNVKKYRLVDIENAIEKKKIDGGKKGLVSVETAESLQSKKATGKKGEEIVKEYLMLHKKELGIIGDIYCACEENDYAHYDFSYDTKEGKIYVEVKSTKANRKNAVDFEMSDAEYEFMRENSENFYVFYINNVYEGDVILRIQSRSIIAKPSKYKASFLVE